MEKTKLVGTMGPASEPKDILREIFKAGLNVARMNFSHGDYEEHGARIKTVRELNEELGTNVALMLDTKGPEMRTNEFQDGAVIIEKGDEVKVVFEQVLGTKEKFSINYPGLYDDVEVGTVLLIDDGYLQTDVIAKNAKDRSITIKARNTHRIKNRRGVNVPNTKINMPFLSEKDRNDIIFGAQVGVDFIAASFVQTAEDVLSIKALLKEHKAEQIQVIAKIENQEGVDNLDEIIEAADGIMYARGDLGVEILPEDLPHLQKEVVEKTRQAGKLIIVATQMVESMQNNPVPTRAEVSDVANAAFDSADSVMLSGEMAAGKYPLEAVKMMKRIVKANEKYVDYDNFVFPLYVSADDIENVAFMATISASTHDVRAIVVDNAELAGAVSKYRPQAFVIPTVTHDEARKLNLRFGVYPVVGKKDADVKKKLQALDVVKGDKYLVVTNDKVEIKVF
ncbi:pyruvate kinase [Haploplasma axanthum]|uniref:Pyruvate kinase n=1 Tax=Haploplasma axanthum TaxID=29552 RepID=A0A449BDP4_HAPAX|nr:pyruvate kinase [Haploplasma axanthum]VEU80548.1 pyruvate kinase [Haploplasma axanthum]